MKAKSVGLGVKALKAQYEVYTELKNAGAQVFEAHVRGLLAEGKTGDWRLVGYIASEGDDAAAALQVNE